MHCKGDNYTVQEVLQEKIYFALEINVNAYLKGRNVNPTFNKYFKIKSNRRV